MTFEHYADIQKKFPFLSGIVFRQIEYIGIIQNSDDKILSFYDYEAIRAEEDRLSFLSMGDTWWWESNRQIPINIFLRGEMEQFRYCLKTVIQKDTEVVFGPETSLNNIYNKRIKRRQIQLMRKMD
jgi:hypothetical protein